VLLKMPRKLSFERGDLAVEFTDERYEGPYGQAKSVCDRRWRLEMLGAQVLLDLFCTAGYAGACGHHGAAPPRSSTATAAVPHPVWAPDLGLRVHLRLIGHSQRLSSAAG
jgi:hypothetical protein